MGFEFRPAVFKSDTLYELPRPVLEVRVQDGWDADQFKVPLRDGDERAGFSRQGVDISCAGQFGSSQGELATSEEAMFAAWTELRDVLSVGTSAEKYEFFLYFDAVNETYRKFKKCSTLRLECDLSNKHLFEYALLVHAEDPVIYTTGPGM